MKRSSSFVTVLTLALSLGACAPASSRMGLSTMPDMDRMGKKQELMQKLMSDPQVPTWYAEREKMATALGDKVFDKDFNRVFDSLTVALASLEANVNNMERQSGYITAAVPRLEPQRAEQLRKAAMVDYCNYYKYDPKLLDHEGPYDIDLDSVTGQLTRIGQAMTISLVRQSPTQTKVKIRFSNVNYPGELQEYYKVVWPAIDKQIFLDKNTD